MTNLDQNNKLSDILKRPSLKSIAIAFAFIGASCLVRGIYIFKFSDYHHYLISDMGGYWSRALEWMHGNHHGSGQWAIWPPLLHILIAQAFILFSHLGIHAIHWLACILAIQIVLGSISVYLVYLIALELAHNTKAAVIVGILYLFAYPVVYLNAFVLSENTAMPLLIAAVFLLIRYPRKAVPLFISGLILGLAAGIRPAYLASSFCFLVFAVISQANRRGMLKAIAFCAGFAVVAGSVCLINFHISSGIVRGLSANGGINYFLTQCKWSSVTTDFTSGGGRTVYGIGPAQFAGESWRGDFRTREPMYHQAYFYAQGTKCLCQEGTWADNVMELRKLFFGPFFPFMTTVQGSVVLDPAFKVIVGWLSIAALALPPLVWILRRRVEKPVALLWSLLVMVLVTAFFFGCERRYLYSVTFATYLTLFGLFAPRGADIESHGS